MADKETATPVADSRPFGVIGDVKRKWNRYGIGDILTETEFVHNGRTDIPGSTARM